MTLLNREPAHIFEGIPVSACSDVTGFGLLGHLWEMIQGTSLGIQLDVGAIDLFDRVTGYARAARHIPGGTLANIEFMTPHIDMGSFPVWYQLVLCDPQTSGGLLIGIAPGDCDSFIERLADYPFPVKIIGTVEAGPNKIFLR